MTPIPVVILTGFLGAGKTTLLNELLRGPQFANTAVLINEFGDVQIDHDLVDVFSDKLITTTTGCLCCTATSDLKRSLFDLWTRRESGAIPPFSRVVVETTGLADPVPVLCALLAAPTSERLDRTVATQFALTRVVTLFDVVTGGAALDAHVEAQKQVALADAIVLTKADLARDPASKRDIQRTRRRLGMINPAAALLDRMQDWEQLCALILGRGTYDLRSKGEDALAWLQAERHAEHHHHPHQDLHRHGVDIRAHSIIVDKPVPAAALNTFIDILNLVAGPNLLRVKGLIALTDEPDRPVVIHGVQHLIHPIDRLERWPSADKRSRIVLIGRGLNEEFVRACLGKWASPSSVQAVKSGDAIQH